MISTLFKFFDRIIDISSKHIVTNATNPDTTQYSGLNTAKMMIAFPRSVYRPKVK